MSPDTYKKRKIDWRPMRAVQRGFSIISAIFLLVVLSMLGAFMVTFSTTQHATSAQDLEGMRAYQAARAGIEWGLFQFLVPPPPAATPACPAGVVPTLGGTLSTFTVTVTSASSDHPEAGNMIRVCEITSTATNGGVPGTAQYVERRLRVTVSR